MHIKSKPKICKSKCILLVIFISALGVSQTPMPELLITWKYFDYQVNIEDQVVIVALKVIRVLLIYSECFQYSEPTEMQGEEK